MSGQQPQGRRSGEGTDGLWNLIRDDERRRNAGAAGVQESASRERQQELPARAAEQCPQRE